MRAVARIVALFMVRLAAVEHDRQPDFRLDHGRSSTAHTAWGGWQWLFLLEALPSIALGIADPSRGLPNNIESAR